MIVEIDFCSWMISKGDAGGSCGDAYSLSGWPVEKANVIFFGSN